MEIAGLRGRPLIRRNRLARAAGAAAQRDGPIDSRGAAGQTRAARRSESSEAAGRPAADSGGSARTDSAAVTAAAATTRVREPTEPWPGFPSSGRES